MNMRVFRLVKKYFDRDYSYDAIRHKLKVKLNVEISRRTLERVVAENNLKKRNIEESHIRLETVRVILQELDLVGVERRRRYQMKNREYEVPQPNYIWHCDGHDKLKQFGFPL
ncbi:hypothetical protein QAD02_011917 [Eretmocerus hayati]|uniref:Uncharacterized protein n=1 Tax=Eretmocerus hayati TaxID=131215 RepID=A0ACC2NY94_9HYME|nr:hypothetical protein QAD02_011917 [Eretmocerus hayati]